MNNFFENHIKEINSINNKSKKERKTTFSRLQKASVYKLAVINGEIDTEFIKSLEGINLHQITEDGKLLFASSDRVYLPDVATRLYQVLENICKSYKSHRVHNNDFSPESSDQDVENINYIDISNWDNQYFKEVIQEIFNSINSNINKDFNIYIEVEGLCSLWHIINPKGNSIQFDEINIFLNYQIECKNTGNIILNKTISLRPIDIRNKKISIDKIVSNINSLHQIDLISGKNIKDLKPQIIIFDNDLTAEILIKSYQVDLHKEKKKNIKFKDTLNENCISESFDKFGVCRENKKSNKNYFLRQNYFHKIPSLINRNLKFYHCMRKPFEENDSREEIIKKIASEQNANSVLYLSGSKEINNYLENTVSSNSVISPIEIIFFDGKNFESLEIDYFEIPNIDQLKLLKGNSHSIVELPLYKMKIGLSGFSHSILKSPQEFVFI